MDYHEPKIIDDFLPIEIAYPLHSYVKHLNWSYGWKSNNKTAYAHWNCDIANASKHNGLDVSNAIENKEFVRQAWDFIKKSYLPDYNLIRCYANAHTHGIEGYIHTDSSRDQDLTVVIYMNRDWRREWHGETVIYDKDIIIKSALPAFNRAMIFKGNQYHCARAVSRTCTDLRMTLMFKCAKTGTDPKRDELQKFLATVGAEEKPHLNGSLAGHLLITYDLLKASNHSESVCLAGGAHSLYGTSIYKDACLAPDQKDELSKIIGDEAMKLVNLFATVNRPWALEASSGNYVSSLPLAQGGTVDVTEADFYALCAIEAANLYEQNNGIPKEYPNLKKFWSEIYKNGG